VCGGTFDHLHAGHKKLLLACINSAERITIGVTSGAMTRHKQYSSSLETYTVRSKKVVQFAAQYNIPITIVKLTDIFGPTLTDGTIDALFCTEETLMGAKKINSERDKIGMKPLSIKVSPYVLDENGDKISSESIRSGRITREGLSYYKYLISRDISYLPDSLREELRSPLGRVISSLPLQKKPRMINMKAMKQNQSALYTISVGDVITYNLKKSGATPTLSIIDGMTRRKALNVRKLQIIKQIDCQYAPNKKGSIQKEAVDALYMLLISGHSEAAKQLFIKGEEDLLTLVAVLFAPLGSHVWYGQQGLGAIDIHVTEKMKSMVYNLIKQFKSVKIS
jgi:phosphopantetheine adenylyltransferase/uncharacterized protein (UPF0218 family)